MPELAIPPDVRDELATAIHEIIHRHGLCDTVDWCLTVARGISEEEGTKVCNFGTLETAQQVDLMRLTADQLEAGAFTKGIRLMGPDGPVELDKGTVH